MIEEILFIASQESQIDRVYGIGSYFRNDNFNDIDLVFVIHDDYDDIQDYIRFRSKLINISSHFEVKVDIIILTRDEFRQRPLKDMKGLKVLL
ncbi:hypothetical protein [Deinococcus xianganensis]